jgi:hypothetical protein
MECLGSRKCRHHYLQKDVVETPFPDTKIKYKEFVKCAALGDHVCCCADPKWTRSG